MWLGKSGLFGLEEDLGSVVIDVQGTRILDVSYFNIFLGLPKNEDQTREGGEGGDFLEPIVVQVVQAHLRFGRFENQITEFFYLQASLEGQLEF